MSRERRLSLDRVKGYWRNSRSSELERLASRKSLSSHNVSRIRALMEEGSGGKKKRPSVALILKSFEATEEWHISVTAGQTVSVLDKLDEGWWLIDLSHQGRGPFGLIPGINCCWTTVQVEDTAVSPADREGIKMPGIIKKYIPLPAATEKSSAASKTAPPPLPPRSPVETATLENNETAVQIIRQPSPLSPPEAGIHDDSSSAHPTTQNPRSENDVLTEDATKATPPALPPRPRGYSDEDLEAAYDYLAKLVNGDGFTAIPPENFNELCRNKHFADLVRRHADELREKRSRQEEEDQGAVITFVVTSSPSSLSDSADIAAEKASVSP